MARASRGSLLRRSFLGRAAAATALGALPACGDDTVDPAQPDPIFQHGVASGDPLPDAIILWTRVTTSEASVEVSWVIANDPELAEVVGEGTVSTDAERDFTVKIDVTGLSAGTTYYYRFEALGETSPIGRTKTAKTGALDRLRFVFCSCASYAHGYFHNYRRIAARSDLDAVLHLGDYIYEYGDPDDLGNGYGDVRPYDPPHEIVTLDDYRRRYAHYRKDADLQEVHRQHPFITVWDDHEFTNDAYPGGAENHQPDTEGDYATRKAIAARVYSEWMPVRLEDPTKIWRSFRYGDLVDLFMLDTRMWGRDEQADGKNDPAVTDETRTLLGLDQEAWLAEGLRASTAQWKILGQQVMIAPLPLSGLVNTDQWDGYVAARERLYAVITDPVAPVSDVVVLTGDIHTSWGNDLVPAGGSYDPVTRAGSIGVEFVTPGITSPGLGEFFVDLLAAVLEENPYVRYVNIVNRGYCVLDVTPERVQCSWHLVSQVDLEEEPEDILGSVMAVYAGDGHLTEEAAPAEPPMGDPPAP